MDKTQHNDNVRLTDHTLTENEKRGFCFFVTTFLTMQREIFNSYKLCRCEAARLDAHWLWIILIIR